MNFHFESKAESVRARVESAISLWHENTCIRFEPYSTIKHKDHRSKVLIKNRGQLVFVFN